MKLIAAVLFLCLLPLVVHAEFTSVGFRAYSTATAVTCSVLPGSVDVSGAFTPNPGDSRVLSLGTKGTQTFTPTGADLILKAQCFPTVGGPSTTTTTKIFVKMFFNGSESVYYPISEAFLKIKR